MSWQHYLENKKPTFLACTSEQVYAAILESSKNKDLFRATKHTLAGSLKFHWHAFCKAATVTKKRGQVKMKALAIASCQL